MANLGCQMQLSTNMIAVAATKFRLPSHVSHINSMDGKCLLLKSDLRSLVLNFGTKSSDNPGLTPLYLKKIRTRIYISNYYAFYQPLQCASTYALSAILLEMGL